MTGQRVLLVVDDSPTIRKLVELSFAATAWRLMFARHGREALELARQTLPDVILLDFVLPDMRGSDVCQELAKDPELAQVPIVVMSGKGEGVRHLFAGLSSVVDIVAKPFAATDIVARVNRARELERGAPAGPEGALELNFATKQAAARAIYTRLRPQLSRIPEWAAELGSASADTFFARKLLTPLFIDEMCEVFARLLPQQPGLARPPPPAPEAHEGGSELRGELGTFPLFEVLRLLSTPAHSGRLLLRCTEQNIFAYFQTGVIVHVTSDNPDCYLSGSPKLPDLAPEARTAAASEQRSSGRSILLAWFEKGSVSAAELGQRLDERGRRLLLGARNGGSLRFAWTPELKPQSALADHLLPIALPSLTLDQLREAPPPAGVEREPALDAPLERGILFSQKLRALALTRGEREILAAVDGERTGTQIASLTKCSPQLTSEILHRLLVVELIRVKLAPAKSADTAPVLVMDLDEVNFVGPLRHLLGEENPRVPVRSLSSGAQLWGAIRSEAPQLVIINATSSADEAIRTAEVVRASAALRRPRMVAVLDAPAGDEAARFLSAGYDAVLVKPILHRDLEGLLYRGAP